jgi:hypothetical protein
LLAVLVVSKRFWKTFPAFFAYAIFTFVASAGLYVLRLTVASNVAYFYAYWLSEAVSVFFGFSVLYDIFRGLIKDQPALHKAARAVFAWVLTALILLGVATLVYQWQSSRAPLAAAVSMIEQAARIVELGLLMFLFVFSSVFGLHWRQQVFGIALGLGLFVAVELTGVTMRTSFGLIGFQTFAIVRSAGFICSLLIWIGYILVPEPATVGELPKREQLEQWNKAVMEFMHQ